VGLVRLALDSPQDLVGHPWSQATVHRIRAVDRKYLGGRQILLCFPVAGTALSSSGRAETFASSTAA
jgi:hypothetical protein